MKILKILSINIFIVLILLFLSEVISYKVLVNKYKDNIVSFNNIMNASADCIQQKKKIFPLISYKKVILPNEQNLLEGFRPIEYRSNKKRPIILFGCSYTYGFGLREDETFSRQLADYTNRTVINRGLNGTGLSFLYYQLSNKKVLAEIPKNTEYIIYTMIPDHFPRLFRYRSWVLSGNHLLRYKIKKDKLVEDKILFPYLHSLYTAIVMEEYIAQIKQQNREEMDKLYYKIFEESYKIMKENFKNSKFVVLFYEEPEDVHNFYKEELNRLKNIDENITILYINELIPDINNKKYWIDDNSHPSAVAWKSIIPILVKKVGIK